MLFWSVIVGGYPYASTLTVVTFQGFRIVLGPSIGAINWALQLASYVPLLSFLILLFISRWILGPPALQVKELGIDEALRGQSSIVIPVEAERNPWRRVGKAILDFM